MCALISHDLCLFFFLLSLFCLVLPFDMGEIVRFLKWGMQATLDRLSGLVGAPSADAGKNPPINSLASHTLVAPLCRFFRGKGFRLSRQSTLA